MCLEILTPLFGGLDGKLREIYYGRAVPKTPNVSYLLELLPATGGEQFWREPLDLTIEQSDLTTGRFSRPPVCFVWRITNRIYRGAWEWRAARGYDAFGVFGTIFRELERKKPPFYWRPVPKTPNAS